MLFRLLASSGAHLLSTRKPHTTRPYGPKACTRHDADRAPTLVHCDPMPFGLRLQTPTERQTAQYHASSDTESLLCSDYGVPVKTLAADKLIYSKSKRRLQQDCDDMPILSIGFIRGRLETHRLPLFGGGRRRICDANNACDSPARPHGEKSIAYSTTSLRSTRCGISCVPQAAHVQPGTQNSPSRRHLTPHTLNRL